MTATTKSKVSSVKPAATVSRAKVKAPELPSISSVRLVPLDLIDVRPQVRTVFDDESIQELAGDIGARGLLQPVLLNPNGARFILIAGERRLRACHLNNFTDIPALITKASEADSLLMQLAENIQREALDMQDQVNTIRLLHDNFGSVKAVAETVKKSSGWVSKRLTLSHSDLCQQARSLMIDGITEDIEILNIVGHLAEVDYVAMRKLEQQLRAGTASRETARQALKDAKSQQKKSVPPSHNVNQNAASFDDLQATRDKVEAARQERENGTGEAFLEWAMTTLEVCCTNPHADDNATAFLNALGEHQRVALQSHLLQYQATVKDWTLNQWASSVTWSNPLSEDNTLKKMAGILTLKGQMIDNLYAFMTILETANRPQKD